MISRASLGTRTFLLGFFPVFLVVIASFFAINRAIEEQIKSGLTQSLHRAELAFAKADSENSERNIRLLSVLTESAGLKAGIGRLQENAANQQEQARIQKTIETQLREVGGVLG